MLKLRMNGYEAKPNEILDSYLKYTLTPHKARLAAIDELGCRLIPYDDEEVMAKILECVEQEPVKPLPYNKIHNPESDVVLAGKQTHFSDGRPWVSLKDDLRFEFSKARGRIYEEEKKAKLK